MTPEELRTALALGREQRNVEFKAPGSRSDKAFCAKVMRAILGMANTPDGGFVVVGVDDQTLEPLGLSEAQVQTWTYDDIQSSVSNYADPYVDLEVTRVSLDGRELVAIRVQEFVEMPVLCKRDYPGVLRSGALYVRRRGKVETVEVPTHVEMREVIDRAAMIAARRLLRLQAELGPTEPSVANRAEQLFAAEAGDFL